MISSLFIYNIILFLSFIFALAVEFGTGSQLRNLFRLFIFILLFIPAAIRFDIGTDYENYVSIYNNFHIEKEREFFFNVIVLFLHYFNCSAHSLFVLYALIIYFPVCFFAPRKGYSIIIFLFVVFLYFYSYSLIRQMAAVSLVIYAMFLYKENRVTKSICFIIGAGLFHSSALFILPLFFTRNMIIKPWIYFVLFFIIYYAISKLDFISTIFNSPLFLDSKYSSYGAGHYSGETEMGSGLGVLFHLFIPILSIIFSQKIINQNPRYKFFIILGSVYIVSYILASYIIIFGRLTNLFAFTPMILAYPLMKSFNIRVVRQLIYILILVLSMAIFEKDLTANIREPGGGGLGVTPYRTIFQK